MKTLAFFEGCNPTLGATIILRGASRKELAMVRNVLRFMIFVTYNSKLEKAFIMDEFGTPFSKDKDEHIEDVEASNENHEVKFIVGETMEDERDRKRTSLEHTEPQVCLGNCSGELVTRTALTSDTHKIEDNDTDMSRKTDSSSNIVNSESFERILNSTMLCSSPLVKFPLPYELTPEGKQCKLRVFMCEGAYWSPLFFGESSEELNISDGEVDNSKDQRDDNVFIKETHPFVFAVLAKDTQDLNALLANYRAQGGRVTLRQKNGYVCTYNGIERLDGMKRDENLHESAFVPMNCSERSQQYQPVLVRTRLVLSAR